MEKACGNCKHYHRVEYAAHVCDMATECDGLTREFQYNKWESKERSMSDGVKVVWPELIVVNGRKCGECVIEIDDDCRSAMKELTGIDCEDGVVFQKPARWVQCTRENTKVGDEVRFSVADKGKSVVEHFYKFPLPGVNVLVNDGERSLTCELACYEINLNR